MIFISIIEDYSTYSQVYVNLINVLKGVKR